jgi:4'-phosphopantetheinyl transferase
MRLEAGEIAIWYVPLDRAGELAWLTAAERAMAEAALDPQIRRRRTCARTELRRILGAYIGAYPAAVPLEVDPGGKPRVSGGPPFNLAHCGEVMLLAVSAAGEVGVDLETFGRLDSDWWSIAELAFSTDERRELASLPPAEQSSAALRTWVRKEAYAKARGAGLAYGFRSFTVRMATSVDESILVDDMRDRDAAAAWRVLDLAAPHGFVASLAHAGREAMIRRRSYAELRL